MPARADQEEQRPEPTSSITRSDAIPPVMKRSEESRQVKGSGFECTFIVLFLIGSDVRIGEYLD